MRRTRSRHARSAFTLAEVLVAVGIILVLVSFLFVGLSKARDSSPRAICANNLRQIMSAISVYASANDKQLPVLPDWAASQHWLCDIGRDQRDALLAAGLQRDSFYCPSGDLQNSDDQWNYGSRGGVTSQGPVYTVTGYFWTMYRVRQYPPTKPPTWTRDDQTMKIQYPALWLDSFEPARREGLHREGLSDRSRIDRPGFGSDDVVEVERQGRLYRHQRRKFRRRAAGQPEQSPEVERTDEGIGREHPSPGWSRRVARHRCDDQGQQPNRPLPRPRRVVLTRARRRPKNHKSAIACDSRRTSCRAMPPSLGRLPPRCGTIGVAEAQP